MIIIFLDYWDAELKIRESRPFTTPSGRIIGQAKEEEEEENNPFVMERGNGVMSSRF